MLKRWHSRLRFGLVGLALWVTPLLVCAGGGEKQGKLVHVADTRNLDVVNQYFANLYNTNRLLFTLEAVAITALMGLILGMVMDGIVGAIGLDLGKQESKE
jgi:hypothetical protein